MLQRLALCTIASLSFLAACSSDNPKADQPADDGVSGDIRQSVTWQDGTRLSGVVRITEGTVVEIAPGAKITCNDATQILIGGTLKTKAEGTRASIACEKWAGILVAKNGVLDIDGLNLENPSIGAGYETTNGAGSVVVKNSDITGAARPFRVGAGSKLVLDHVKATTPDQLGPFDTSVAEVFGTLEASYLEYEANSNEGIMLKGEEASATITDSILKGKNGKDLISAYAGSKPELDRPRLMKVSYTTFIGAHCGPHLQGIVNAEFDHITSREGIIFGITIYDADTVLIKDSNLDGAVAWLDFKGPNPAKLTIENVFAPSEPTKTIIKDVAAPVKDQRATAEIAGAGPR